MRNKEEFIQGILEIAKNNMEKDGYLLQMLFLDTDKGMFTIGLAGISNKEMLKDILAEIGKQYSKKGVKIDIVFLLSDATSRKFPVQMKDLILEGRLSKDIATKYAMDTTDSIIMAEWDLTNDYQATTSQRYHRVNNHIIFDGELEKNEKIVINMLDPFVQNYKLLRNK